MWLLVAVVAGILVASALYDAGYRRKHGRTPKIARHKRGRRSGVVMQRREALYGPRLGDRERRDGAFGDAYRNVAGQRKDRDQAP